MLSLHRIPSQFLVHPINGVWPGPTYPARVCQVKDCLRWTIFGESNEFSFHNPHFSKTGKVEIRDHRHIGSNEWRTREQATTQASGWFDSHGASVTRVGPKVTGVSGRGFTQLVFDRPDLLPASYLCQNTHTSPLAEAIHLFSKEKLKRRDESQMSLWEK